MPEEGKKRANLPMQNNKSIGKYLMLLVVISTIIRAYIAASIELGNDEVYYRLYARYPDWSHFDHPMMIGAFIQFFSLDLFFDTTFFMRLSSIVFGGVNTWLVYLIGKNLKNPITGFYASLLYTASIYSFVITGIFILPDTPQSFFWLVSILIMLKIISSNPMQKNSTQLLLLLGFSLGLGMLSKYTTVFLWFGMMVYMLIHDRSWLKKPALYYAMVISLICVLPILIWNIQNDFISFSFHSDRVDVSNSGLRVDYFFTELVGEILYNNPINFGITLMAVVASFRGTLMTSSRSVKLLLWTALPLILVFLGFSLFRRTLPHWTAPAYTGLIPLAAVFLYQIQKQDIKKLIPSPVLVSLALLFLILSLGIGQINHGLFDVESSVEASKKGADDPSLDMYGYGQIAVAFKEIHERDIKDGSMLESSILIGDNWFPLANLDFYVASPLGMKSYGLGQLDRIHKYAWINQIHGGFNLGMDAYYITTSRDYRHPNENFAEYFERIESADTIAIWRGGKVAKNAFVFRLKNMEKLPADLL